MKCEALQWRSSNFLFRTGAVSFSPRVYPPSPLGPAHKSTRRVWLDMTAPIKFLWREERGPGSVVATASDTVRRVDVSHLCFIVSVRSATWFALPVSLHVSIVFSPSLCCLSSVVCFLLLLHLFLNYFIFVFLLLRLRLHKAFNITALSEQRVSCIVTVYNIRKAGSLQAVSWHQTD